MVNYQGYQNPYQTLPAYQPPYPQQVPMIQPQMQQNINNPILAWVQSEDEGVKYPLNAGQSIFLMNQHEPYLYMKSVDQLGKTTFIKKRLVDETENTDNSVDLTGYIRKEEIEDIIMDIVQKEVEKRVSQISFKPTRKKTVVVDEDED